MANSKIIAAGWNRKPGIEVVKLSMHNQNAAEVEHCDGIIVQRGRRSSSGIIWQTGICWRFGLKEIIPERDQFEYEVIEKALAAKKPVLGICRGFN